MESSNKILALILISLLSVSSSASADPILEPECGYCTPPVHKPPKKTDPKLPKLPVPPVTVPKLPVPPVTVPKLPVPPVTVPKLPVPPVTVPKLPLPPVTTPKLPLPPVTVPKLPLPPVTVPKLPVPPITVPKLPLPPVVPKLPLPPVSVLPPAEKPPKGKGKGKELPCPPPVPAPAPKSTDSCPIDALKLGACVDLLGGLVHIGLGDPAENECCPIISGLAELEAAACLCTTLKVKALNLQIYVPIALQLLVSCGKTPPPGYTCSV